MRRAGYVGFVLLLLASSFHLTADRSAAARLESSAGSEQSNGPVDCNPATLGSAGASATTATEVRQPAGPNAATASSDAGSAATATDESPLWSDCEDCNPIRHPILDLMLAIVWTLVAVIVARHVLLSLGNRLHRTKLEEAVRRSLADKDLDRLAHSCRVHKKAAAARVITAIVVQAKVTHATTLTKFQKLKQAGRSETRTVVSKWTSPLDCLDCLVCASLIVLAALAVSDLARSLNDMSQSEAVAGAVLRFWVRQDFPILWCGLLLLVLSVVNRQIVLSRASKLELRINQLSIDFIVGLLSTSNRQPAPKYRPGMWMAGNKACSRRIRGVTGAGSKGGLVAPGAESVSPS